MEASDPSGCRAMGLEGGDWGWLEGEAGRVGGVGNDLGMAGGVCHWEVFF